MPSRSESAERVWRRLGDAVRQSEAERLGIGMSEEVNSLSYAGFVVEVTGPPKRVTTTSTSTTSSTTTTTAGPHPVLSCGGTPDLVVTTDDTTGLTDGMSVTITGGPYAGGPYVASGVMPTQFVILGVAFFAECDGTDVWSVTPATTSATSSTTTTTCFTNATSTTGTTTTTTPYKILYPGRFVYRNVDSLTNQSWWYPGEDVFIQEVQGKPLGFGCRYPGTFAGQYRGLAVVGVMGTGTNQSCTGSTTTTTCACARSCVWELRGTPPVWAKTLDCHGAVPTTTTSGTGTTLSSTLAPTSVSPATTIGGSVGTSITSATTTTTGRDHDCDCPPPTFCPGSSGPDDCSTARTMCFHGYTYGGPTPSCDTTTTTGTGTTSSTSSTTTTTPDPDSCGSGCAWRYVAGVGAVQILRDCRAGVVTSGGWICGDCTSSVAPPGLGPCESAASPCLMTPPPPPPPGCGGECRWVCGGAGLGWFLLDGSGCYSGLPAPCNCATPTGDCPCGAVTFTPCFERSDDGGTGTSGTGTSTTGTGTTTTAVCGGRCTFRWDVGLAAWVVDGSCGAGCGCSAPIFPGLTSCDVAEAGCQNTTTTTATTSTTTTTTTTSSDCSANCTWTCRYFSLLGGTWLLTTPCAFSSCYCDAPAAGGCSSPADSGTTSDTPCNQATTTVSTTRTTTTTTDVPCNARAGGCAYRCSNVGYDTSGPGHLPSPVYGWLLCRNNCPPGPNCSCNPPNGLGPCDGTNVGDVGEVGCTCVGIDPV